MERATSCDPEHVGDWLLRLNGRRKVALLICVLACGVVGAGCAKHAPGKVAQQPAAASATEPANASPATDARWTLTTFSPQAATLTERDAQWLAPCARVDAGLMTVAGQLAEHQARTGALPDNDEMSFAMRAAGVPYVWPRAWALVGETDEAQARAALHDWLASFDDGGERRCGIGHAGSGETTVRVVIALDAIAELEPVRRQARLGQWLEVRATLLEPATGAEVVVLGPRGAPRSVPTSLSKGRILARVPVDAVGPWLIQVLPALEGGPRPAAEALVFVDSDPPLGFSASAVPGESAASGDAAAPTALLQMLNAARQGERLAPLQAHPELTQVARAHAQAMLEAARVAHDLGAGDPAQRVSERGLTLSITGENVARADTLVRAHRALWASPSHRGNMLHSRFTHAGIGVAVDPDGGHWVCEVFGAF